MRKMNITKFIAALIIAPLLITSCGSKDDKTSPTQTAAVIVSIANAEANINNKYVTASGKVAASNSANLSTRMMGFVENIHVDVGDKVRKGQLLISINNADLKAKAASAGANVSQATAAFQNAEKDYIRFTNLFKENSASQKELDDMTSRFEMARAQLEAAKQMKNEVLAQFSYVNIRAPFDGVITNKFIEEGNMANPGMTLLAIETPGRYEVMAMVPESEISNIEPDISVDVVIKSLGESIKGKVTEVSTSAKNTGGQFLVKVALDKTDANILSGMFATVQFPVQRTNMAKGNILVPKSALISRGQLSGIYTVSQNNTALLRWLRLGRSFGENVEVLSGLSADESYIISSEAKLYNGVKISIQ